MKDAMEKQEKDYHALKDKQENAWWEEQKEEEKQNRSMYQKLWSGVLIGSGNAVGDTWEGLKTATLWANPVFLAGKDLLDSYRFAKKLYYDPQDTLNDSHQTSNNMSNIFGMRSKPTVMCFMGMPKADGFFTNGLTSLGLSILGGTGISKAGSLAKVGNASYFAEIMPKINNYELAPVGVSVVQDVKQVPYNVINDKELLSQIDAKVDEVYGSGKGTAESSNTVWNRIKITQPVYDGTKIPKSFEITAGGEKFWVHPNGTKHMVEYITKDPISHGMPINSQTLLSSFQNSVKGAVMQGIKYDEIMYVGNWELIFSKPRGDGLLPVIKTCCLQTITI